MTVAAFMDLALYHPHLGYYARAARRSGRAGDFFTSVDVGPLFGELIEAQLAEYLERAGARLEPGWRAEIGLAAIDWIREAAKKLRRGFMILIDYGHPARELYSPSHSSGTLMTFARHGSRGPESPGTPAWLQ